MGSTFRMRFKSVKHNKSHKIINYIGHSFLKITLFSIAQRPQRMIVHNIYGLQ